MLLEVLLLLLGSSHGTTLGCQKNRGGIVEEGNLPPSSVARRWCQVVPKKEVGQRLGSLLDLEDKTNWILEKPKVLGWLGYENGLDADSMVADPEKLHNQNHKHIRQ